MRCRPPLDFCPEVGECDPEPVFGSLIPDLAIQLFMFSLRSLQSCCSERGAEDQPSVDVIGPAIVSSA
jgi:hypothetical protein